MTARRIAGSARVRGTRRTRAPRRRSRRAANRAAARRAACTTHPIMVTRRIARIVPATHPWYRLNLGRRAIFALSTGLPNIDCAVPGKRHGERRRNGAHGGVRVAERAPAGSGRGAGLLGGPPALVAQGEHRHYREGERGWEPKR